MSHIIPPVEIMAQLADHCKQNELGLASAWGEGFGIVLVGLRTESPDRIALLCAQALIEGILNNAWNMSEQANADMPVIVQGPDRSQ